MYILSVVNCLNNMMTSTFFFNRIYEEIRLISPILAQIFVCRKMQLFNTLPGRPSEYGRDLPLIIRKEFLIYST